MGAGRQTVAGAWRACPVAKLREDAAVHELFDRPVVTDDQRNVSCPDLATVRYVYRPAGEMVWDGKTVAVRERWMAVWRDDPEDVLQTWYPDAQSD